MMKKHPILFLLILIVLPAIVAATIWGWKAGVATLPISVALGFFSLIYETKNAENKASDPDTFLSDKTRKKVLCLRIIGSVCFMMSLALLVFFG